MPWRRAENGCKSVLISGAGVAGPTVAFWLRREGFVPTLIERAAAIREGGYMIDFWGVGYDVAERMGLIPSLRATGYRIDTIRFVDGHGHQTAGFGGEVMRRALGDRFFSLLRADLAHGIDDTIVSDVETIFGDSVAAIRESSSGVEVELEHGNHRTFDLVIGADGLHSAVRALAFGPEAQFEKYLGYYCASFVADDYPHRDDDEGTYLSYAAPGRQVSRYALRGGRTAFFFVFAAPQPLAVHPHDVAAHKAILRERFRDDGWQCRRILEALDATSDLYFDAVSQIRLPAWSRGRVALVGDAAYCPSLLAGQGASFAMAGAYVLAGELAQAGGDYTSAFPAYEARLRTFIDRKQVAAEKFATSFAPRTRMGLFVRNQVMHLMAIPAIGAWITRRLVADRFDLPEYVRVASADRADVLSERLSRSENRSA